MKKLIYSISIFLISLVLYAWACTFCNGTGIYTKSCEICQSSGRVGFGKCVYCNGAGFRMKKCPYCGGDGEF